MVEIPLTDMALSQKRLSTLIPTDNGSLAMPEGLPSMAQESVAITSVLAKVEVDAPSNFGAD